MEAYGLWAVLGVVFVICAVGFVGAPLWVNTLVAAGALWVLQPPAWLWAVFAGIAVFFNLKPLRRYTLSNIVFNLF